MFFARNPHCGRLLQIHHSFFTVPRWNRALGLVCKRGILLIATVVACADPLPSSRLFWCVSIIMSGWPVNTLRTGAELLDDHSLARMAGDASAPPRTLRVRCSCALDISALWLCRIPLIVLFPGFVKGSGRL